MSDTIDIRIHGSSHVPTLIYLPGLHGDWTLVGPFRTALGNRGRLVEVTYPRRKDWTLDDFAEAVEQRLLEAGITSGWIMGESFSSQVAWALLQRAGARPRPVFEPRGLFLVGGFVKHPWPWGVHLASGASRAVPAWLLKSLCSAYSRMASRKHRHSPELIGELKEFVQRRIEKGDREAINHRYGLISSSDFRALAKTTTLPVFQLTGGIDPIVPWWHVGPWLKRHCPGFRERKIFWRSGHNVLLGAPGRSADQLLAWIEHAEKQKAGKTPAL